MYLGNRASQTAASSGRSFVEGYSASTTAATNPGYRPSSPGGGCLEMAKAASEGGYGGKKRANGGAAEVERERRKTGQGARERRTTCRSGRWDKEGRLSSRAGVEEEKAGLVRRSARRRTRRVAEASLMRRRNSDRSQGVD